MIENSVPRATQPTVSADAIAQALGLPRPTEQQRSVIESALGPTLVIAGAGSGKTETMANRVLWLLANNFVGPGEILGLTFTRKAAGELDTRIRERIAQLGDAGLMKPVGNMPAGGDLDAPVVATYNSFANTIFRDNAILIGRESDGAVLGEASAWQLARSIVTASRDPRLNELDASLDTITDAVLSLSHALSENMVNGDDVAKMAVQFGALGELPNGGRGAYAGALELIQTVSALPVLLDLAEAYSAAKAHGGFVEYADQVALALTIVRRVPSVAEEFTSRFKVVLLDEYQDTSVVQTWLLSELFAGHCVMAVGDPHQSIYGWRGASAANLEDFAAQFAGENGVEQFALSTSWRNGTHILDVANQLVEPLREATRVPVESLGPSPSATKFPVTVSISDTLIDEAQATAQWLKVRLAPQVSQRSGQQDPPTAAMLFRARKTQRVFVEALRDAGVPYHVLGIGGLLDEPEIADLVSALRVISDPMAGSELIRLLAGSRWRVGVRDLKALHDLARWLNKRDHAQQEFSTEVAAKLRASVAEGEGESIVDALDFLARAPGEHRMLESFSDSGVTRLRDAGKVFSRLRARSGLDLLDFVTLVEQDFRLDIEVVANNFRPLGSGSMEGFFDALNRYLAVNQGGSLRGFLAWLREAVKRDDLAPRTEKPERGAVQLLTIHGAKGLEWDLVVVPRVVDGELPGSIRDGNGWTSFGTLPYEFRGDAAELPVFQWREAESRKDLLDRHARFKEAVKERHQREERRLAYVAVTRARHELLLSGSFWSTQIMPRQPSEFLRELEAAGIIDPLPALDPDAAKPDIAEPDVILWPEDPLGHRRSEVECAAERVRVATPKAAGRWQEDVELLLAERERALRAGEFVELPTRIPASRFKDYVTDPASVAADLRRPMPEKPYRASRLGTLFHSWVEERAGVVGSAETIDVLSGESDTDESAASGLDPRGQELDMPELDTAELARLKATFEKSEWAVLKPVDVERELHLPFDGRVVICKIDAIYERNGRYQIVDWKTGKAPKSDDELADRQLQLALYRLAFARWKGIDPTTVDAVFYYVSDDRVIAPTHIDDEAELLKRWRESTSSG